MLAFARLKYRGKAISIAVAQSFHHAERGWKHVEKILAKMHLALSGVGPEEFVTYIMGETVGQGMEKFAAFVASYPSHSLERRRIGQVLNGCQNFNLASL